MMQRLITKPTLQTQKQKRRHLFRLYYACTAKAYEARRDDSMYASSVSDVDKVLTTREFASLSVSPASILRTRRIEADSLSDHILEPDNFGATGELWKRLFERHISSLLGKNLVTLITQRCAAWKM